jgi:cell division protein FtsB
MRFTTLALLALLAVIHAELWFGKGGVPRAVALRAEVKTQQAANAEAQARNEQLAAEVRDLQEGLEMVEEKARYELSMVKPDEIYVHLSAHPPPSDAPAATPGATSVQTP